MAGIEIKELIPHREPFLFLSRIVEISSDGSRIVAEWDLDPEEWFFKGHFPGNPITPGLIVAEALAQAGGCLVSLKRLSQRRVGLLGGVEKFRFHRIVRPGETLTLEVQIRNLRSHAGILFGRAHVGGEFVTEGEIFFIISNFKKTPSF